jgi:hypothetical protein
MAATDVLGSRSEKKYIEQKYIDRVLMDEGQNMLRAQDKVISRYNVKKLIPEITRRRISVSSGRLTLTHPIRERFIDMKTIRGQRQKAIQLHNKVLYRHFNSIVGRLAYGFTEDVRNLIAKDQKIHL